MSFVLRYLIFLWPAGILGKISGECLNRIFISFSGVSFNVLSHQNVCTVGPGVIFWLVSFLKKVIEEARGPRTCCPEMVRNV